MFNISSSASITKLDTVMNIISGVFSLEAYLDLPDDYDPEEKIVITQGRFDFNYNPDGSYAEGHSNRD